MSDTTNASPASRAELQANYERLAQKCAGFDEETRRLHRQFLARLKEHLDDRKQERAALVRAKGEAYAALQAALQRGEVVETAPLIEQSMPAPSVPAAPEEVEPSNPEAAESADLAGDEPDADEADDSEEAESESTANDGEPGDAPPAKKKRRRR